MNEHKHISKIKKQFKKLKRMIYEYELMKKDITLPGSDNSELYLKVVNVSGLTIKQGQSCYLCGGVSDGIPTVTTVKHHGIKIAGNATDDINRYSPDNKGYIMIKGTLRGCDSIEIDYS